jgi:hypothetical protein
MSDTVTLPIVLPLAAIIPGLLLAFSYGRLSSRVDELARALVRIEQVLGTRVWQGEERREKS